MDRRTPHPGEPRALALRAAAAAALLVGLLGSAAAVHAAPADERPSASASNEAGEADDVEEANPCRTYEPLYCPNGTRRCETTSEGCRRCECVQPAKAPREDDEPDEEPDGAASGPPSRV